MKKYKFILIIMALGILEISGQEGKCNPEVLKQALSQLDSNAVLLKDFQVWFDAAKPGDRLPLAKYSMILNDSSIYQFTIASSDEYPGKAQFQLFSDKQLLGSTYNPNTGKLHKTFTFRCAKTAKYHMFISFIDGKEGCAVGVLSYNGKYIPK